MVGGGHVSFPISLEQGIEIINFIVDGLYLLDHFV